MTTRLSNYDVLETLHQSDRTTIYRARDSEEDDDGGATVILKVWSQRSPSATGREDIGREYEIASHLKGDGFVPIRRMDTSRDGPFLVQDDVGGASLDRVLKKRRFEISEFLALAIAIAETVGQMHDQEVIHKDLNPSNIIWDGETGRVWLIDFGLSTRRQREHLNSASPRHTEGTLPYISPEQTGRTKRLLDYRTDFYSLGVTFYEMLTGRRPFETSDDTEMIHHHLAHRPPPVEQVRRDVPHQLSRIIMKLLAKQPEERYQSAHGVVADLRQCQRQLEEEGEIEEFELGRHDVRAKLRISERLYGRREQLDRLMSAFQAIKNGGRRVVLVGGGPGVGKSALVNAVHAPIVGSGGWFVTGKFEPPRSAMPYTAVGAALAELIENLLGRRDVELSQWRREIGEALGEDASLVAGVVPELESIIDISTVERSLDLSEAQHRFHSALRRFVGLFSSQTHPLVLCLDDLQWADDASLELLRVLMADEELEYLLVLGTFRNNMIERTDPLKLFIDDIRVAGGDVEIVDMPSLDRDAVRHLVADSIARSIDEVAPLADLIHRKTSGNPYFVHQFLTSLYHQRRIWFDAEEGTWNWDQDAIAATPATENVVEMLTERIQELDEQSQRALKYASLLTRRFSVALLATICGHPEAKIYELLEPAIQRDIIVPTASGGIASTAEEADYARKFAFPHDQVQETVAGLWDPQQRASAHLKIGRMLKDRLHGEDSSEQLFSVVEHLNQGIDLIDDDSERRELVRLNAEAGSRALNTHAKSLASELLSVAQRESGDEIWDADFELARQISLYRGRTESLLGRFEEAEKITIEALEKLDNPVNKAPFYGLLIRQMTLQADFDRAFDVGQQALEETGYRLDVEELDAAVAREFQNVQAKLDKRDFEEWSEFSADPPPEEDAALEILAALLPPAGLLDMRLLGLVGLKVMSITLDIGVRPQSVVGIVVHGMALCSAGETRRGYEMGQMAMGLAREIDSESSMSHITTLFGAAILPWSRHLRETLPLFREGKRAGLRSGTYHFAGFNAALEVVYDYFLGSNLDELAQRVDEAIELCGELQNVSAQQWATVVRMMIHNLQGETESRTAFCDEQYESAQAFLHHCEEQNNGIAMIQFRIARAQAYYLHGYSDLALADLEATADNLAPLLGTFDAGRHPFYHALALADVTFEQPEKGQKKGRVKLEEIRAEVARLAGDCPPNFQHKLSLVDAEIARLNGEIDRAMRLYDDAIHQAGDTDFVHLEALANERAGLFWLEQGKEDFAALYLREARYIYELWCGRRKVELIDEQHGELLEVESPGLASADPDSSGGADIDVASVFKASEAIASPVDLDELLSNLMEVTLENAGAESGTFFVVNDELCAAVEGESGSDPETLEPRVSLQEWSSGARSIVRYVYRTGAPVVLGRAYRQPRFQDDPHIRDSRTRSVLCIPIAEHGHLRGILYAENNLVDDAFTEERIRTVKILAGHIAIALNKARLYASLREEKERFRQLAENIHEVFWLMDWPSGEIVYLSPAYEAVWGRPIPADAISQEQWLEGIDEKDRQRVSEALRQDAPLGQYEQIYRIERPSGSQRWIRDRGFPIRDEFGETYRIAGVAIDFTREHEVDRMKEEFISVVSHELRTPLTPVTGIFSMLTKEYGEELPEEVRNMAQLGLRNSRRLLHLIDDLLDIQKLSMDKVDFEMELLDLREVVLEALELNEPIGAQKGTTFEVKTSPVPLVVEADRSRLLQVLTNLLSNAIKFSPGDESVEVEVRRAGKFAHLSVTDRGPGIPVEAQDKVFEKFTQADSSLTRRHGGTGLGLAIVRAIVERLKGRIYFDTEVDRGTTFIIELPLVETA